MLTNNVDKNIITRITTFIANSTSINTFIIYSHIIDSDATTVTCGISWKHVSTTTSIPTPTVL